MPPPPGKLSFAMLVAFVGASENTVRRAVRRLEIDPERPGGTITWYTTEQAEWVRADHEAQKGKHRTPRMRHSSVGAGD